MSRRQKKEAEPSTKKTYTIIAGVNGAGKTSLYNVMKQDDRIDLGQRINIDEIVSRYGDWRDNLLQIKAAREAMRMISDFIDQGVSFHQETTLPGKTILRQVQKAKENGYRVRLFYVGVESVELALERVHKRMGQGGHGLDDDIICRRFEKMRQNIQAIYPLCDKAVFYDNTTRFRQVAFFRDKIMLDCDANAMPKWFFELLE